MKAAWLRFVPVCLALVAPAGAQEAREPWIGKRVITHYGAALKVGDAVVDESGGQANRAGSRSTEWSTSTASGSG